MIYLENVSFVYDDNVKALNGINLKIQEGEAVALIGVNGCGKSTLIKIINGLLFPTEGVYYFDDVPITKEKFKNELFTKNFHKKIGFIFQNSDAQLFCTNVYDEIAFGLRQMKMNEEEVEKRVSDIMKLLKIEELKNRTPYHLSGGEKKKVAIAAAVVLNPEVYVFDEPMNGLDPRTKEFLKDFMKGLNNAGKTIICSTHDFFYVEGIFKRAVVFSDEHTIIRDGEYDKIINDTEFLRENNIL